MTNDTPIPRKLTDLEKEIIGMKKDFENRSCKKEELISTIEKELIRVGGDVAHIKNRIDNGLTETMKSMEDKLNEFLPIVKDNQDWITRIKGAVTRVTVFSVVGGLIALMWHLIKENIS